MSEGVEVNNGTGESIGSISSKPVTGEQEAAVADENIEETAQPHADDTAGLQHFWL